MIPRYLQFKIKNYKFNVIFNFAADIYQEMYKFNDPPLLLLPPKYMKCLTLFLNQFTSERIN